MYYLISKLDNNWKMVLKPDYSKPAQEMLLSRKKKQVQTYPTIIRDNFQIKRACYQKCLVIILDENVTSKDISIVLFRKPSFL